MKTMAFKFTLTVLSIGVAVAFGWLIVTRLQEHAAPTKRQSGPSSAPVEVAPIERGAIELRRTFSGALEAQAEFVLAPKVSGRIQRLSVDIADPVRRGQVVAELDDAEYVQAVAQAKADYAVANANLGEAGSALEITIRDLARIETLRERGVTSDAQFDAAQADKLAKEAALAVAKAQLAKAEASLETVNIRLGYTKVTADWTGGDDERVVAERFVDDGATVSANTALLSIVEMDPIIGVIFVTEKEYGRLQPGQAIILTTDAYPGETFDGRITRIAPVFRAATRQARVELTVANPGRRLKPGMFIRATVTLDRVDETTIVPDRALSTRGEQTGVFVVNEADLTVAWRPVTVGIRDGSRVQVTGEGLSGRVITLGHQLVDDGSTITIPTDRRDAATAHEQGPGQ